MQQIFYADVEDVAAKSKGLKLYTNPATDMLHINLEQLALQADAEIYIYSTTGRVLQAHVVKQGEKITTVNIENLPEGVYLCALNVNGERLSSIFVKK